MGQPERTCVGCRRKAGKGELTRIVAAGGSVEVDLGQRLPGRGAYLHPGQACLELAVRRRAVTRALRIPGYDPEALTRRWAETAPPADPLA